jgi:hypothetical protein
MQYTTLGNGDIIFHKKNTTPPPDLKNYDRDTTDPWLFHPRFPSCIHLEYKNKITKCKKIFGVWTCNAKDGETTCVSLCNECIKQPNSPRIPLPTGETIKVQPCPNIPIGS